jgi:acetyl-CoA C-acetyltransferase
VTLLHELQRTHATRGVAALCVGGGQGQAIVVRNGANGSRS